MSRSRHMGFALFRRDNLESLFVEDSIDFKKVKHFALDAERENRILCDDRRQREASLKQQLVRFRSRQAERKRELQSRPLGNWTLRIRDNCGPCAPIDPCGGIHEWRIAPESFTHVSDEPIGKRADASWFVGKLKILIAHCGPLVKTPNGNGHPGVWGPEHQDDRLDLDLLNWQCAVIGAYYIIFAATTCPRAMDMCRLADRVGFEPTGGLRTPPLR